ncbi:hypothetical protein HN014_10000 [Aquimarina sp. TRL1]|uniref:hypothetical protein n=1 Tax=Aquimarina sp. (strain TRL1) TaxID=2736252 RepID=UPI00158E7524|nr:hypothetical protein [Aquimarina sp. TRL1]QKX05237.1 hypothetical protein HN014_10000 [Aquimarina sp. TRL1]
MSKIGRYLFFIGLISTVLNFLNYELRILMWIDSWGTAVGWGIRIGLTVLGLVLMMLSKTAKDESVEVSE